MSQQDYTVRFPFGDADVFPLTASGEQDLSIDNNMTIIDGAAVPATGDRTIDLTIGEELMVGSMILVKLATTDESKTIFGTGFSAPDFGGVAGDSAQLLFIYDGTDFLPITAEAGAATDVPIVEITATGAQAIEINSQMTVIDGVTVPGTAARTLNLTIDESVQPGARILVKSAVSGSTYATTPGTGFSAPAIAGVDGKTHTQAFTFDGTTFLPDGTAIQIN